MFGPLRPRVSQEHASGPQNGVPSAPRSEQRDRRSVYSSEAVPGRPPPPGDAPSPASISKCLLHRYERHLPKKRPPKGCPVRHRRPQRCCCCRAPAWQRRRRGPRAGSPRSRPRKPSRALRVHKPTSPSSSTTKSSPGSGGARGPARSACPSTTATSASRASSASGTAARSPNRMNPVRTARSREPCPDRRTRSATGYCPVLIRLPLFPFVHTAPSGADFRPGLRTTPFVSTLLAASPWSAELRNATAGRRGETSRGGRPGLRMSRVVCDFPRWRAGGGAPRRLRLKSV